ncbi:MAG: right-handed parallel beta-helix repeat-containing protein [Candidatus Zixiibacteriota bacterium]
MLLLCAFSVTAYASTIRVAPGASHQSLRAALSSASPGDTIRLGSGVYAEPGLDIIKPLTIIGDSAAVIDAGGKGEAVRVLSDDVTIRNVTIRGSGVSFIDDNAGLRIEDVRRCTVEDCRFENNFFGIYLARSADCRILRNSIVGSAETETRSGNGIHLWYCRDIVVDSNTISGHRDGIYFEFVVASRITHNRSTGNLRYGLHFMYSDSCLYAQNAFVRNNAGVAVMYTRYVTMIDNTFDHNWGPSSYGLLLKDITDSEVRDNQFRWNTVGIHIEGSNRLLIERNRFLSNGWGMRLMASSIDNRIERNDFIGNSIAVTTNSRSSFSVLNENFWSDYDGYDLDGDGYGDVPFRPVGIFSLIVERNPPALVLMRSLLVDVLDMAERLIPTLTPETLIDPNPSMEPIL